MKKLVSLLLVLAMFLSVAALADDAIGSPVPSEITYFTPEGITPALTSADDETDLAETVEYLVDAIAANGDYEEVFGSSEVENLDKYELVELVGLEIEDYDSETMDEVVMNIKFAASFDQDADLVVLLGLIDDEEETPEVEWESLSFKIEANGTLTVTMTEEQAEEVIENISVIAVLQAID